MKLKSKDTRQYNGKTLNAVHANDEDYSADEYNESGSVNPEELVTTDNYEVLQHSLDISIDMLKLMDSPTLEDVFITAAKVAKFIINKK